MRAATSSSDSPSANLKLRRGSRTHWPASHDWPSAWPKCCSWSRGENVMGGRPGEAAFCWWICSAVHRARSCGHERARRRRGRSGRGSEPERLAEGGEAGGRTSGDAYTAVIGVSLNALPTALAWRGSNKGSASLRAHRRTSERTAHLVHAVVAEGGVLGAGPDVALRRGRRRRIDGSARCSPRPKSPKQTAVRLTRLSTDSPWRT